MVNYEYETLFGIDSTDKQMVIETEDKSVRITNTELHNQEFELNESLCSEEQLKFGCCEASSIKFKISNVFTPLKDKWVDVTLILDGHAETPLKLGKYKVFSDVPTGDRRYREIVAYDAMYDIINTDVADWYNAILPNKNSTVTMKNFRASFAKHFGIEEEKTTLANDDMIVEKTIEPSEISGKDVITAICEINGCFGHMSKAGKIKYVYLTQGIQGLYPADNLYPDKSPDYLPQADTRHLYPQDPKSIKIGKGLYISCKYEDYLVRLINKVQIRQEENDVGCVYGKGNNCYIVQDNFLVYGKSPESLAKIAKNLYEKITGIVYRPYEAELKGNPCLEVGDPVRFPTKYELVESYVLKRTLKGIQALKDTFSADGQEEYSEKVNSINKSIIQLKGKTNTLTRTVEENQVEVKDIEKNLSSRITQNANSITSEVKRAINNENVLSSRIEQTVKSISLTVNNGDTTAGIVIKVTDEDGSENSISGTINMTGIVSFSALENEGQTVINGSNIITGKINCDLLEGGEIRGQVFKGGGKDGENYNFQVTKSATYCRNKFYLQDADGTSYMKFDGKGKGKLSIENVVLKLGDAIRLDPESNIAVFSTPQEILIKGEGDSPGTWGTDMKKERKLSDGSKIKAWDIGDAIQYICRHEIDSKAPGIANARISALVPDIVNGILKGHGLIS